MLFNVYVYGKDDEPTMTIRFWHSSADYNTDLFG